MFAGGGLVGPPPPERSKIKSWGGGIGFFLFCALVYNNIFLLRRRYDTKSCVYLTCRSPPAAEACGAVLLHPKKSVYALVACCSFAVYGNCTTYRKKLGTSELMRKIPLFRQDFCFSIRAPNEQCHALIGQVMGLAMAYDAIAIGRPVAMS